MKKFLFILNVLLTGLIWGQTSGFNYKALLSENQEVLANQPVVLQLTLMDVEGTIVYAETHSITTDENGIVNANIGEGTVIGGDFAAIDWSNEYFLKVELDTGSGFQDFGTTAFKYVPYAKFAVQSKDIFMDSSSVSVGTLIDSDVDNSISLGREALKNCTNGTTNVALGYSSLKSITISSYNTGLGSWTLSNLTSGTCNVAVGVGAMGLTATGSYNTVVGFDAGRYNNMSNNNVMIGYHSGFNTEGSGNVLIGYEAGYNELGSDKLYIANNSTDTPLIWGDFSTKEIKINGNMEVVDRLTSTDSGNADMKAYIYGSVQSDGTILADASSDGFAVEYLDTGNYKITFNTIPVASTTYIVSASASSSYTNIGVTKHDDYFEVFCRSISSGNLEDRNFDFVVYKK